MVAKVISGQDIKGALNYNEQKVLTGNATCILASGFLDNPQAMNFYQKLSRFTDLNERNLRTKTNTLHISLNFDPSEKPDIEKLSSIAVEYMNKIGFGAQPFLAYEHTDAAHPHVHIVTTIIQKDGKRLPIHNLGKNQSETARKEIEIEFGLVRAQGRAKSDILQPLDISKAIYGKSETRRSISNIVRAVSRTYKYSSVPELNAALRQYNVTAERGSEQSQMFQKKGLLYSLVDQNGNRIGIPLKASSIQGKPMLTHLEKQFKLNEVLRQPLRDPIRAKIENALQSPSVVTPEQFSNALNKSSVTVTFRRNKEGRVFGVTFIDNKLRCVFNGSDLGKRYSAGSILETLAAKNETIIPVAATGTFAVKADVDQTDKSLHETLNSFGIASTLKDLINAEDTVAMPTVPSIGNRRRRKKRRF